MRIRFYKSFFCPRCRLAKKTMSELITDFPDLEIEEIDVVTNPARALADGVRMIPCLQSPNGQISGIFLNRRQIKEFLSNSSQLL